tara:strand:+ start:6855 stop:7226 length:372 start_codon:yes stop_codon:yes gene_type:complete
MDENQINKVIQQYKNKKEKEYNNYHTKNKLDPEYMQKNKDRARDHYNLNKDKRADTYKKNKDLIKARSSYYYYLKNNKLDTFIDKFPHHVDLLKQCNIIKGSLDPLLQPPVPEPPVEEIVAEV